MKKVKSIRTLILIRLVLHAIALLVGIWAVTIIASLIAQTYVSEYTAFNLDIAQAVATPAQEIEPMLIEKNAQLLIVNKDFRVTQSIGAAIETRPAFSQNQMAELASNAGTQNYVASIMPIENGQSAILLHQFGPMRQTKIMDVAQYFIGFNLIGMVLVVGAVLMSFVHSIYKPLKKNFAIIEQSLSKMPHDTSRVDVSAANIAEGQGVLKTYNIMLDAVEKERKEKEAALEVKRQLISNLAHDLKSPITVLKGYTEVLACENFSKEEQKNYISYIEKSANDLNNLTNLLFEQTKYQSGDGMHFEKHDVNSILRDICANYYMIFDKNGFEFNSNITEQSFITDVDIVNIKRVFSNLLQNILNHNPNPTQVNIVSCIDGNSLVIEFMDDGVGINPENKENIFEAFFQEDTVRNTKNSGLGLYVCREIISKHNGYIQLGENCDYKTVFKIVLNTENISI